MRNRAIVIAAITLIFAALVIAGCAPGPVSGQVTYGGTTYSFSGNVAVSGGATVATSSGGGTITVVDGIAPPWIPPTIETTPRECNAYVRDDGFHMDTAVSKTDGKTYDVTIVSSIPAGGDLCDEYRIVQDGANSSMIQDRLPQPPGARLSSWERDFTFLGDDWTGVPWAYYAGVSCRLEIDHDKVQSTTRMAVLDENGKAVQYSHGTQRFRPVVG